MTTPVEVEKERRDAVRKFVLNALLVLAVAAMVAGVALLTGLPGGLIAGGAGGVLLTYALAGGDS